MTYLLDTDTCIQLLRGAKATVAHAAEHPPVDLAVSVITQYELLLGVEKCPVAWQKKESGKVRLLINQLHALPFTSETAGHAAALRAALEASGQSIGPMDVLIAATALEHDLTIVTSNLTEFRRVPGLRCEAWSE